MSVHQRRLPRLAVARASVKALLKSARLPPGGFDRINEIERTDRLVLQKLARKYGPVFRGIIDDRLAICVVGNPQSRRLLRSNKSSVKPVTIDVSTLFPGEFMRGMAGVTHKSYRAALIGALGSIDFDRMEPELRDIVRSGLRRFSTTKGEDTAPHSEFHRWSDRLSEITTGLLIRVVLGAGAQSPELAALMEGYSELGPNGVAWNIGQRQLRAFARLSDILQSDPWEAEPPGLLQALLEGGRIDETMRGNLIYMVETGRYDMRGLFRWISKYAADHPDWMHRIASATGTERVQLAEAFVEEVLRMDQSERLMRDVLEDFVFEGFLIPKGAILRLCMWEAHKDEETFADPFAFDPGRFLGGQTYGERFSPFGLDQHHCPFGTLSIRLAALFLTELACGFRLTAKGGEPPVRGPYHWEPAPDFSPELCELGGK